MHELTIYICTYNRLAYLKKSVESVLRQSFTDFDLCILDNCSTDGTKEYGLSLESDRIHYRRQEKNIGGIGNITYAFMNCESKYICVFHDDDICDLHMIEKEISYLRAHPNCSAVSCLANIIDENDNIKKVTNGDAGKVTTFSGTQFFCGYINAQKSLAFPSVMYRTDLLQKNGIKLKKDAGPSADVVFLMDIEKAGGELAEIQEPLFYHRMHSTQDSTEHLEEMLLKLIRYLKKDEYYAELLNNNERGKASYYRWYLNRLIIRVGSGAISRRKAITSLNEMKVELKGSCIYTVFAKMIISVESATPKLSAMMYRILKGRKDRQG